MSWQPEETASNFSEGLLPEAVIPVIEEKVRVGKRRVETGGVRVIKTVHERTEIVDEPLLRDDYEVERIPLGHPAGAEVPQMRQEGDTVVIPIMEEILVVKKQLIVKEELRITRRTRQTHQPREVTLRKEEVAIERFNGESRPVALESEPSASEINLQTRKNP